MALATERLIRIETPRERALHADRVSE